MQIEDIHAFSWIAQLGSLSRAARDHGVPKATLSLRLARLEGEIGTPLLVRSGSGMTLTEAGLSFLSHAEELVRAHQRALDAATGLVPELQGRLRVGVTEQLATNMATPLALAFTAEQPGITLDLQVMTADLLFAASGEFDCLISGQLPNLQEGATLVAQGFYRYQRHLYASPTYLAARSMPRRPEELSRHDLVGGSHDGSAWVLRNGRDEVVLRPRGPLTTNDEWVAKVCVLQDRGISLFPDFFAAEHLATGELVTVLPEWGTVEQSVTVLHHPQRFQNAHIRAFIDFLKARFHGFYSYPYRPTDVIGAGR